MTDTNKSIIINAVDRSLDVLEYLFDANQEVPITQISRDLGIYKSTVYRTLATLQNRGYVKQNPETDKYSLGFKAYLLGSRMRTESAIEEVAAPYLKELNERFHEAVNLSVMNRDANGIYNSIIIASESSPLSLNANTNLGDMNECYCSAVGKCLLAFTEGVDLSIYDKYPMVRYNERTITTVGALRDELIKVRRQRYAVDNEEREAGLYCLGAPILLHGSAVASISISGPVGRMKEDGLAEKIDAVKAVGEELSQAISLHE